jgi:hypothetical protein
MLLYVDLDMESEDRSSNAIKYWMPLAVIAAAITFVITFVMRLPPDRTIVASALAGILVFSGFFFRSFGKDKEKYEKKYKSY